jgi:Mn-dependent DtxR family transcriptional regulator
MNVSKKISTDIMKYLQENKEMSIEDIAKAMSASPNHIQEVINKKAYLKSEDIDSYTKNQGIRFWEFAIEAIPMGHLSEKTKNKVLLCQQISSHIKKKNGKK